MPPNGYCRITNPSSTAAGALIPLQNHGIKCMSMGFLLPPLNLDMEHDDTAVVWRGLMVQKAVQQLLFDVDWQGPLDVLIVDLPPGTGDVALGQRRDVFNLLEIPAHESSVHNGDRYGLYTIL